MHNPRIENGQLVYDCSGQQCESVDGTHRLDIDEVLLHMVSTAEEFLLAADLRGHSVAAVAALFKQIAFGDSDLIMEDDLKFNQDLQNLRDAVNSSRSLQFAEGFEGETSEELLDLAPADKKFLN